MPIRRISTLAALLAALLAPGLMPARAQSVRIPGPDSGRFLDSAPPPVASPASPGASGTAPARDDRPWPPPVSEPASADGCSTALSGSGRTYHVGPGRQFTELDDVPWLSLQAGDVVNIHHRAEPYRTKIGLRAQGRADAPVVLHGVTDAQCRRPVISGENATTARDAAASGFFSKQHSEPYGLIFIYKSRDEAWGSRPRHIRIENLKLTGAHKDKRFTGMDGQGASYVGGAAAIYAIVVEDLTVENCEITGNGNGIFVNSRSDEEASRNVFIRHNRIWNNGNVGSWLEHNLYVQTARALYEGNDIGQLVPGARGSSLKDRSSGTVVRYNRITAAARALDLVEIEGGVRPVREDPLYDRAWVVGNLIINDFEQPGGASVKMIHWGGDNDERFFRGGTLEFAHNTVIARGEQSKVWYMALFDLPTERQTVRASGNLIASLGSTELRLGHEAGTIELAGTNWISRGWVASGPGARVRLTRAGRIAAARGPGAGLRPAHRTARRRAGAAGQHGLRAAAPHPPVPLPRRRRAATGPRTPPRTRGLRAALSLAGRASRPASTLKRKIRSPELGGISGQL